MRGEADRDSLEQMSSTFTACLSHETRYWHVLGSGLAVGTSRQVVVVAATKGTRHMVTSSQLPEELYLARYLVDVR